MLLEPVHAFHRDLTITPGDPDKAVRFQSIRGRMALHGLIVPTQAHWYPVCPGCE